MAKGSKRHTWLKDGMKMSKKKYKKYLAKKVRRYNKELYNNCSYKKIDSEKLFEMIP